MDAGCSDTRMGLTPSGTSVELARRPRRRYVGPRRDALPGDLQVTSSSPPPPRSLGPPAPPGLPALPAPPRTGGPAPLASAPSPPAPAPSPPPRAHDRSAAYPALWGTDIPRVHWKDKRPHERPKGPINRKVTPSWAWGGTTSKADRHKARSVRARMARQC
jgi:hypothetical protein